MTARAARSTYGARLGAVRRRLALAPIYRAAHEARARKPRRLPRHPRPTTVLGSGPPMTTDLPLLAINTIRTLAIDTVQKANSGHPGLPLGCAPLAYVLWHDHLKHDPRAPQWFDRDRFVLSAGHGSALLYALLHLFGYDLSLDDLKQFRQWGSRTPGHPEWHETPGVEATTGPLGQGAANAVGMAIAERYLAGHYNRPGHEIVDHHTFALVSDGDVMEGVCCEAASLAGHLGLGKLIYLYDANQITLDGPLSISMSEDVGARFAAYGWHVLHVEHGDRDLAAIDRAIRERQGRDRAAVDDRHPHHDRLRLAEEGRHQLGARLAARRRRGRRHQEGARLGSRREVPRAARGRRAPGRGRGQGRRRARRVGRALRRLPGRAPRARRRPRAREQRRAARRLGRGAALVHRLGRDARRRRQGPRRDRREGAVAVRRRRRPRRLDQDDRPRRRLRSHRPRPQPAVRHPRARHGLDRQRHALPRRHALVRGHVLRVLGLHAAPRAARGAQPPARDLHLDARLGRPRRGRPDAPARRAPDGAARDPEPVGVPPRGRQRDRGRLALRDDEPARPDRRSCSRGRTCRR